MANCKNGKQESPLPTTRVVIANAQKFSKMKKTLVLLTIGMLSTVIKAQVTFIKHYGENSGQGNSLILNSNNNYIVAGRRPTLSADQFTIWEINSFGDTLWQKHYGTNLQEQANQIIQTIDGGYVTVGYSAEFLNSFRSIYLLKTTSTGEVYWAKHIGGEGHENGTSIVQTDAGEYFIGGSSAFNSNGLFDFYLVKTDINGDTIWTKKYGGSMDEESTSMRQTSDGGFILAGYTESFGNGLKDIYLIKTNNIGDTLWTKHYGGALDDVAYSVRQTLDGGYILTGYSDSSGMAHQNMYVVRTNSVGDTLWTKTYSNDRSSVGKDIIQTSDGGFAMTGSIKTASANGGFDLYVVKIDESGNLQWEKDFKIEPSITTYTASNGASIIQTPDSGFAITGSWFGLTGYQLLVVKLDNTGTVGTNEIQTNSRINIFPNPFNHSTTIKFDNPNNEKYTLTILDFEGRIIQTIKNVISEIEIEKGYLSSGLYYFQLQNDKGIGATGKLMIVE